MATISSRMTDDFKGVEDSFTGVIGTFLILMSEEGCALRKIALNTAGSLPGCSGKAWKFIFYKKEVQGSIHAIIQGDSEYCGLEFRFLPYQAEQAVMANFQTIDALRQFIRETLMNVPAP